VPDTSDREVDWEGAKLRWKALADAKRKRTPEERTAAREAKEAAKVQKRTEREEANRIY
jgi:hypothetical protein